eukprot:1854637-Amphidinium_carterae.1
MIKLVYQFSRNFVRALRFLIQVSQWTQEIHGLREDSPPTILAQDSCESGVNHGSRNEQSSSELISDDM